MCAIWFRNNYREHESTLSRVRGWYFKYQLCCVFFVWEACLCFAFACRLRACLLCSVCLFLCTWPTRATSSCVQISIFHICKCIAWASCARHVIVILYADVILCSCAHLSVRCIHNDRDMFALNAHLTSYETNERTGRTALSSYVFVCFAASFSSWVAHV